MPNTEHKHTTMNPELTQMIELAEKDMEYCYNYSVYLKNRQRHGRCEKVPKSNIQRWKNTMRKIGNMLNGVNS